MNAEQKMKILFLCYLNDSFTESMHNKQTYKHILRNYMYIYVTENKNGTQCCNAMFRVLF